MSVLSLNDRLSPTPIKIPKPRPTLDDAIRSKINNTNPTKTQKRLGKLVKMNTISSFKLKSGLDNCDSKIELNSVESIKPISANLPVNLPGNVSILTPQDNYFSEQHSLCVTNKIKLKRPSSELKIFKPKRRKHNKTSKFQKVLKAKKNLS